MKKNIVRLAGLLCLTLMVSAVTALAQSQVHTLKIRVDFPFNVGSQELPAGEYEFRYLNNDSSRRVLQIRSTDGQSQALAHSIPSIANNFRTGSELIFNQYGEQRFLSGVQLGDSSSKAQLPRSKVERTTAGDYQKGNAKVVTVRISPDKAQGISTGL